jgi:hypothetical protein
VSSELSSLLIAIVGRRPDVENGSRAFKKVGKKRRTAVCHGANEACRRRILSLSTMLLAIVVNDRLQMTCLLRRIHTEKLRIPVQPKAVRPPGHIYEITKLSWELAKCTNNSGNNHENRHGRLPSAVVHFVLLNRSWHPHVVVRPPAFCTTHTATVHGAL